MNAIPPSMTPGIRSKSGQGPENAAKRNWTALQEAANVVASLAGLDPERSSAEVRDFPALIGNAAQWRREFAEQGIDDMTAMLQPGIAALLGIEARGADPREAALALWHEFTQARAAVLSVVPPAEMQGPPRSA